MTEVHPVIEAQMLGKSFGNVDALKEINLSIAPGSIFGPNGAGKSTFLRLVLDLIRPTSGVLRVLGVPPHIGGATLRRRIGYLPGDLRLDGRVTGHAVLHHLSRISGPVEVGVVERMAKRLELDLSRPIRTLSKGNKQKIGLIQAFMHRPELLVLDEPTSGLDPLVQQEFLAMVKEAREHGQTVLLSSHVLSEIQQAADVVSILRSGRVVSVSTVDQLRMSAGRAIQAEFSHTTANRLRAGLAQVTGLSGLTIRDMGRPPCSPRQFGVTSTTSPRQSPFSPLWTFRSRKLTSRKPYCRSTVIPAMVDKSLPVFRRALSQNWLSLTAWTLGVAAALLLYLPLFPSIGGRNSQISQLVKSLPDGLVRSLNYQNITSGSGYVESTFYGLIGFLLIAICAVSWGTAAIAGDEESGGLELTLAHAVTRKQLVLERALAITVRLIWLTTASVVLVFVLNSSAELNIRFPNLLAAAAAWLGLGLLLASIALAVGAFTGRRIFASGIASGVAVVFYFLNAVNWRRYGTFLPTAGHFVTRLSVTVPTA